MKKLLSLLVAVAAFASGAVAQDEGSVIFQKQMDGLARVDPYMHTILADHIVETRQIFDEFSRTGNGADMQKALSDLVLISGASALSRASDAYAIGLMDKTVELVDVLIDRYPKGCRYFDIDAMPGEGLAIPDVAEKYRSYLEAKYVAYKTGNPGNRFPGWRLRICCI